MTFPNPSFSLIFNGQPNVGRALERVGRVTAGGGQGGHQDRIFHRRRSQCPVIRLYRFGFETQGNFIDLYVVNPKSWDPGQRPLGFIIPTDWKAPRDTVSVFRHYPLLAAYMAMIKQKISDPTVVIPDNLIRWSDKAQGFAYN